MDLMKNVVKTLDNERDANKYLNNNSIPHGHQHLQQVQPAKKWPSGTIISRNIYRCTAKTMGSVMISAS